MMMQTVTTLWHYNISIVVSLHQLQVETTTLLHNNFKGIFFFAQHELNDLKILTNMCNK